MVDSDYMLAPVARAWLLDDPRGRTRAQAFLAQRIGGETVGARMVRNLRFVLQQAAPFARDPRAAHLIALKPGMDAGEWRDSNDGLAGGRLPYDVNAVLVPAALDSAAALQASGLLRPYLTARDTAAFAQARAVADIWRAKAPPMFDVAVPAASARRAVSDYARTLGVPDAPALAAIGTLPVRFPAIALDGQGRPIPVQNSDPGFALLFEKPSADALKVMTASLIDAFPAGLRTDAGMLVANPAFADAAIHRKFSPNAYHGTVIWSWQQALMAAGLARQLERQDLPADVRHQIARAQSCLWDGIEKTRSVQSSELWSWRYADGRYQVVPFGAAGADVDESNAAQLWSTVYLALRRPAGPAIACTGR
jgi:glycogen debranching enzyme